MRFCKLFLIPIAFSFIGAFINIKSAYATGPDFIVDNDPILSWQGGAYDNMTYYGGVSGSFYNDMRLSPSISGSNAYYKWTYTVVNYGYTSGSLSLGVYLNNANFTDPYAEYIVENFSGGPESSGTTLPVGHINQNTAPAGWTTISCTMTSYYDNNISSGFIQVRASSGSYKQLGADAIHPHFNY